MVIVFSIHLLCQQKIAECSQVFLDLRLGLTNEWTGGRRISHHTVLQLISNSWALLGTLEHRTGTGPRRTLNQFCSVICFRIKFYSPSFAAEFEYNKNISWGRELLFKDKPPRPHPKHTPAVVITLHLVSQKPKILFALTGNHQLTASEQTLICTWREVRKCCRGTLRIR